LLVRDYGLAGQQMGFLIFLIYFFEMFFCLLIFNDFIQWLQANMLSCPSKKYLHIECPGCGLQRSVIALMQGDPVTSFKMYAATIPMVLMMLFLLLHVRNKYENGALILRGFYLFCAAIIVTQYFYKIVTHQIILH
jgi:hypothetical protein